MEYSTVIFLFHLILVVFSLGLGYFALLGIPTLYLIIINAIIVGIAFWNQDEICDWVYIKINS